MKKVLSVLTAVLLLVSSVSAQQFKTRPGQKTKMDVTIERTQKNRTQPLKAKAFQQKEVKSSVFAKQLKAASKTNYTVTASEWGTTYYAEDNDWYTYLMNEDQTMAFFFDIVADTLQWGHTYVYSDMIADWTYIENSMGEIEVTNATFNYNHDTLGLVVINATMTDVNGDNYTITYQEPAVPEATDTIALTMTRVRLVDAIASQGAFQFYGVSADGNYSAAVAFNATSLVGTFTDNDAFMDATFIEGPAGDLDARRANGTVTANANGGYDLDAYVLCMDAHCYHLTFSYVDPVATDTIDIVATNLDIDDSYASFGIYFLSASNADYDISMTLYQGSGNFTLEDADITLTDLATGAAIDIFDADFNITGNQVLGGLLGYDNVYYNLDLSFVMPESTRTETITVPAGELSDLINYMGAFQAVGYNAAEDRYVSFVAYTDQIAGHYTTADIDDYYTYVADVTNGEENADIFDFLDGDVTVTYDAATSVATLSGTLLCQNSVDPTDVPLFTINMTCAVSVPGMQYDAEDEDYDEEFSASEVDIDDQYFDQYGVVLVNAESATTMATVSMEFNVANLDENTIIPAGNYIIDDSEMPGTVFASPGVQNNGVLPSFAGYLSEDGQSITAPLWFMEDGNVTVTASRIEVNATNSYGRNIHVVMNNGVGINDVENAQVSIYPNPATAQLNVVAEGVKMVEIMDATGRCVLASENAGSIDISNLANGIYMVRTLTNEGVNVQKIVKK